MREFTGKALLRFMNEIEAATIRSVPKPTSEKAYPWYSNVAVYANPSWYVGYEYRNALTAKRPIATKSKQISYLKFIYTHLFSNAGELFTSSMGIHKGYFSFLEEYHVEEAKAWSATKTN